MAEHKLEIVIGKDGKVQVHVKGAKGKVCTEYADWLADVVGKTEHQKLTSEYYEPEEKNAIHLKQELKK